MFFFGNKEPDSKTVSKCLAINCYAKTNKMKYKSPVIPLFISPFLSISLSESSLSQNLIIHDINNYN